MYGDENSFEEDKSELKDNSRSPRIDHMDDIDEKPLREFERPQTGQTRDDENAGVMWPSSSSPSIGCGLSGSPNVRRQEVPIGGNNPNSQRKQLQRVYS